MIRQSFPQITFACKKKPTQYTWYLVPSSEEIPLLGGRAGNTATRTHHSRAQRHGRSRVKGKVLLEEEREGEVIDSRLSFKTRQVQTRRSCQRKQQIMFCFFSETEIQQQKATTTKQKQKSGGGGRKSYGLYRQKEDLERSQRRKFYTEWKKRNTQNFRHVEPSVQLWSAVARVLLYRPTARRPHQPTVHTNQPSTL